MTACLEAALDSVLGIAVCGLIPYLLFRKGAMHGGDVKLFAAVGALLGVFLGIGAELWSFLVAGFFALGKLAFQGKLLRTLGNAFFITVNPVLPRRWRRSIAPELMSMIRLGGPICAGTFLALLDRHGVPWR
jgi:prepilin peptidase CpaA